MNFRLRIEADGEVVNTTFERFAQENDGVPRLVESVETLSPGEQVQFGETVVTRAAQVEHRFTRVRVPIDIKEFRGASTATVVIDRKRLTISFRPHQRRTVVDLSLSELAERYLAKQVRLNAIAKTKKRRTNRRNAR